MVTIPYWLVFVKVFRGREVKVKGDVDFTDTSEKNCHLDCEAYIHDLEESGWQLKDKLVVE